MNLDAALPSRVLCPTCNEAITSEDVRPWRLLLGFRRAKVDCSACGTRTTVGAAARAGSVRTLDASGPVGRAMRMFIVLSVTGLPLDEGSLEQIATTARNERIDVADYQVADLAADLAAFDHAEAAYLFATVGRMTQGATHLVLRSYIRASLLVHGGINMRPKGVLWPIAGVLGFPEHQINKVITSEARTVAAEFNSFHNGQKDLTAEQFVRFLRGIDYLFPPTSTGDITQFLAKGP